MWRVSITSGFPSCSPVTTCRKAISGNRLAANGTGGGERVMGTGSLTFDDNKMKDNKTKRERERELLGYLDSLSIA